jgi:hypothetical protein
VRRWTERQDPFNTRSETAEAITNQCRFFMIRFPINDATRIAAMVTTPYFGVSCAVPESAQAGAAVSFSPRDLRAGRAASIRISSATLFDAWLREVEPVLGPPSPDQPDFGAGLTGSTALTTGEAQLKLVQGLLQLPGLSDASRTALLTGGVWVVPQLPKFGG